LITISGNYQNLGVIISASDTIEKLSGYSADELINTNISRIMPKGFGELHNFLLDSFMRKSAEKKLKKSERIVFI